jgi:Divergent InlB B-repeat domain/PKD domain/PASTA domain
MRAITRRAALLLALSSALVALSAPSTSSAAPGEALPLAGLVRPVPFPSPFAAPVPPHLNYYGGPIMPFTENAIVVWGGSGHSSVLTTGLPSFLADFANAGNANPYNAALEYPTQGLSGTTTNQPITMASRYLGSFTITPSTSSTHLTDLQVSAELKTQIANGSLPTPRVSFGGPVTEYYVMFPPTYSICLGTSCSNVQFCAYHSNATYAGTTPFTYTILPESTPPDAGCGANYLAGGLGNLTSMVSHEMVESMTDAEVGSATTFAPPLAWYDPASGHGEIADICNAQEASVTLGADTWVVQKQWSNTENACISAHGVTGVKGVLASFALSTGAGPAGFDASPTTTPNTGTPLVQYAWDWGDGTSTSGASAVVGHAYATPGTHLVTVIATDGRGASGAAFMNVTTRNLTVGAPNGQVTSAPVGMTCGAACSANFLDGASVSLTATPASGFGFAGWTGDCAGQSATCVLVMNAAHNATATFAAVGPPPAPPPPTPPSPSPPPPAPTVVCRVPAVKGQTLATARTNLQTAHCVSGAITRRFSRIVRLGRVISQGVPPGTQLARGASVALVVSKGRAPLRPPVRVTLCYRHHTVHVTRAVARRLRRHGATLGPCRRRR